MDAQVTISLSELDKLRAERAAAHEETANVRLELAAERARPPDEQLAQAYVFVTAAKEVVDYAVGNLSPEFSRAWPYESLRTLAQHVATIGEATTRDKERALLWNGFVDQIIERDREWSLGKNVESRVEGMVDAAIPKGPTKDEYLAAVERGQRGTPIWVFAMIAIVSALVSWGLLQLI